jgi:hypothetical protein
VDKKGNDVMLKDADAMSSNQYTVRLLGDISNALNVTYDILPIEQTGAVQVPYTAILPSEYSFRY